MIYIVWVDLRSRWISGSLAARLLEEDSIACNKNTVSGDQSALNARGIRLGTPALITRGLVESDMDKVSAFIDEGVSLAMAM
jgi:glycine hydroxymethyltransferase